MKIKLTLIYFFVVCSAPIIQAQEATEDKDTIEIEEEEVLEFYEISEPATYPGGETALNKYISNNLTLTDSVLKYGKSGTILVQFTIETDGSVSDVTTINTSLVGYGMEDAVVQLFREMPKWKPARQRDQPARMRMRKPIRISLN